MKAIKKNYVCGIAYKDVKKVYKLKSYNHWRHLIERCNNTKKLIENPCYEKCTICKEWLTFSNYKTWFDNHYVEGWVIDKDLFSNGKKIYSPDTCCFIPVELNTFLASLTKRKRTVFIGTGVRYEKGKYYAKIKCCKKTIHLGVFNTLEEAEKAYKIAKKQSLHALIEKYKDKLGKQVIDKLLELKFE